MSGLSKHLALTKNEQCLATRRLPGLSTPPIEVPAPDLPDLDAPPVPFEGDFFGQYGNNDFPEQEGLPPAPALSVTEDDDDDDDEDDEDDENFRLDATIGWEPPIRSFGETVEPSYTPSMIYDHPMGPRLPSPAERDAAERTTRAKTFVVPFPGDKAGTPATSAETTSPTYAQYQHDLNTVDPNNLYAPFTSKMDWEVARWAKLRGAGSTSFNDLTKIEGVRSSCLLPHMVVC